MLTWRLAYRNLFRHKTRLLLNLILLIGAFTAIIVFRGFKVYVVDVVKDLMVETQFGHVQVAKPTFWNRAPVERETDRMIEDPAGLIAKLSDIPNIRSVSPRVSFYGLVNTESESLPARLIGLEPKIETKMQDRLVFMEGGAFTKPKQAIISSGLQKILKIKPNQDVTIVSPTLDGSINAMDLQVTGVFKTGFANFDTATVFLSVQDAQKIFASQHVDNLVIFLKDPSLNHETELEIQRRLPANELQIKSWTELSDLYTQVENFYNFQNACIEGILLLLLVLSVSNTMTMTVFERLGEIGTLRAMGEQENEIRYLILLEAFLLALLAIAIAMPFSFIMIKVISSFEVPLVLPMSSRPLALKVEPSLDAYIIAPAVCLISVVLACIWPAKKAAGISIVTALRTKI